MLEILLSPPNVLFSVALGVLFGLVMLEILSWLLGFALSHTLDSALNVDIDHGIDIDHGVGLDHGGGLDHSVDLDHGVDPSVDVAGSGTPVILQMLDWIHVGAVPVLILFMFFLLGFGVSGIAIQENLGRALPIWLAAIPATLVGLGTVKFVGGIARKHVFREDTTAISHEQLVGHEAIITLGLTRKGHPTQAKLKDQHGQTHYIIVEALREGDEFDSGDSVLLIKRDGHKFYVIENSIDTLLDLGQRDLSVENHLKA